MGEARAGLDESERNRDMAGLLYFAKDGSYGAAEDLTILSTEHWSEAELEAVKEASDTTRLYVALKTADEIAKRRMLAAVSQEV